MAITDKKVSETYAGRDISSLSDRPNEDGLTGAQLKARFDQLGKEVIPNYNDLIDELNDVVLPSKADQSTTYTKTESDNLLGEKVDKVSGKSLVSDTAITDLTDSGDTTLHKHDTMYYTESENDALLLAKVDKVVGSSLVADATITDLTDGNNTTLHIHDSRYYTETEADGLLDDKVDKVVGSSLVADTVMTDLTDGGDSTGHYHATDRSTDNHTDGVVNKVFTAIEQSKLSGIEALAEVNNISDVNATDLTDGGDTTLHIHDTRYYTETEIDTNIYTKTAADTLLGNKVDKVAGKSLVSDTAITDLTDGGDTTLHTHKLIQNEVAVNNAKVEALALGTKISRNIADANPALIVNQVHASSTGNILDLQFGGVQKAKVDIGGSFTGTHAYLVSMINKASVSNSRIYVEDTGSLITRNIADANTCLKINQVHASSTGLITDFQFGGVSKASVDKDGVIKIGTKTPASASAAGVAGTVCWDADWIFVCVATNTWKRVAIATW